LSAATAAAVWALAGPDRAPTVLASAPALIGAAATYLIANTLLVTAVMALAAGRPVRSTWWRSHRPVLPAYAALVVSGIVLAALWSAALWLVPCVFVLLAALYYALKNTVALETTTVESLFRLAAILDARDPYTHGHSMRVGEYAERLALTLGLPDDQAYLVLLAGRLHDIGKCATKQEVLLKPGPLDDDERAHMCTHAVVGGRMLEAYPFFGEVTVAVRAHHERWDGRGYPDGLAGEAIPLGARLIAVADAWDAMTSSRPYRAGLAPAEAERRLIEGAGTQWDPDAVAGFVRVLADDRAAGRAHHERHHAASAPTPVELSSIVPLHRDNTPRAADGTPLAHSA
jgi:putative nucleotidyltransferase with HDIG domain